MEEFIGPLQEPFNALGVILKNSNTYGIPDLHFNCGTLSYHGHYLQDFEHISEGSSKFEKAITGIKKPASGPVFCYLVMNTE